MSVQSNCRYVVSFTNCIHFGLFAQQFRALIPGSRQYVVSTGRACFRVTRAICFRNREWTDFISRSRELICTRTDEFGLIIARVRAILNETGHTPYKHRVLVRKNYCMTYWQLEDTWLIYGLCQLIPCTEICCRLLKIYN